MKKFVIFLDADGVINNYDWIKRFADPETDFAKNNDKYIDKRNIQVLNNLMKAIKDKGFKIGIVISSAWRSDFEETTQRLMQNGLMFPHFFDATPFRTDRHRGKEIKEVVDALFLKDNQFVIIDDETKDIEQIFDKKNIIKTTGIFNLGLTQENVDNFLSNFFSKENEMEK